MSIAELLWNGAGIATTITVRKLTSRVLHQQNGEPALSRAVRRNRSVALMFAIAVGSGIVLAFGDVLQEHRKQVAEAGI